MLSECCHTTLVLLPFSTLLLLLGATPPANFSPANFLAKESEDDDDDDRENAPVQQSVYRE